MTEIISRDVALERGLKRYFTGAACSFGHVSERYTRSQDCLGCCRVRIKKQRSTPEGKKKRCDNTLLYRRRRRAKDPEYRKKLSRDDRARINKNPVRLAKRKEASSVRKRRMALRRGAVNAASFLTSLTGVGHAVVRLDVDDFQAVPMTELFSG